MKVKSGTVCKDTDINTQTLNVSSRQTDASLIKQRGMSADVKTERRQILEA